MKKYEFMNEFVEVDNRRLFRIRAIENFGNVSVGDVGGYLENEENLSQKHSCWVSGQAKVYDRAKVSGDAKVSGYAEVFDDARICGNARISGWAKVGGKSVIDDDQEVGGYDRIGIKTEKEIVDTKVVSETPFESLDIDTEQIKLPDPEIVAKKEITGGIPDGLFSIGYSSPLGAILRILSAGRSLDKDVLPKDSRKDISVTLDKKDKTRCTRARVTQKGLDLRILFDSPISTKGDKPAVDALIFLAKKIREQCWDGDGFVGNVVTFSLEEYMSDLRYKIGSNDKQRFSDSMKVLMGIQINGSASQNGETKLITDLSKYESLFSDWHEENGVFYVFIEPHMWSILTAQRLVLPRCFFAFGRRKFEARLLYGMFEVVKKELAIYGVDARKFSIQLDYLCRRAGLPIWDHYRIEHKNKRVMTALENVIRILNEENAITGISARTKYSDFESNVFLKNSCVDVSVLKATAAYYKEINRETNYDAILTPVDLQPYSEKKEIAGDLSLKTETKSLTLEDIWAGIDARVKAHKHETTTP